MQTRSRSDWVLHEGDCLASGPGMSGRLAMGQCDHVITDPPYESEAHTKGRRGRGGGGVCEERPLTFDAITDDERRDAAFEMVRVARRWVLVFCQVEAAMKWRDALVAAGAVYRRTCVWIKPDGAPQFTGDRPGMGYESIVCAHKPGRSKWNGGGKHGVFTHAARTAGGCQEERGGHPTVKPESLMEELVRLFTDPGDLICDPFAGSGTTGVAAIRLGRRFIGWEKSEKYHAIAVKRLSAAREQLDMWERRTG